MSESKVKAKLKVVGRVQGVFYRVSTREKARELDLKGWVRNRRDGSVEVFALGSRGELEKLVDWCKVGPAGAAVDRVDVEWLEQEAPGESDPDGAGPIYDENDFEIIDTH